MTYVDAINQSNAGGAGASASAKAILADALVSAGGVVHGAGEVEVERRDPASVMRPQ